MTPSPERPATGLRIGPAPVAPGAARARGRVTVREVRDPGDPRLSAAHRLLRLAFGRDELVSIREWRDSLAERDAAVWTDTAWHLLVAEQTGRVLGAASGTYVGNLNLGVMGYLVVHPDARGLGLGPRLRRRLRGLFFRDARRLHGGPLGALVGEVRRDNPWLRRLIRRPSVVALDFPYCQPDLRRNVPPVEFVLYRETFEGPRRTMTAKELRQLLYNVWRRVYRIPRPMSSPVFRRMMRSLAGRRVVGELELADLGPKRPVRADPRAR